MAPHAAYKSLTIYRIKLSRRTVPVTCPHCRESILPIDYEKHASQFHGFHSKYGCVWCQVKTWERGKKHANADHLIVCFEKFVQPPPLHTPQTEPPPLDPENLRPTRLPHSHPEKDHFGVPALPIHTLPDTLPDLTWSLPVDVKPLFLDDNLNLAAAYILRYFEMRETHEFYHVFVKAVALERFYRAIGKDKGDTRTLLFSCWCDAGPYEDPMYRQHRHMIAVSPRDHFEKHVWGKVEISEKAKPNRYYPCKGMKRIESPMHLLNTIGYLSNRESRCESDNSDSTHLHHFYLHKTLPVDFRLPLALLWSGGLEALLYERQFQHVDLSRVIERPVSYLGGQWKQKIKHFYGHERGLVVSVAKGLTPTRDVVLDPALTFHLLDGEKLYFYYSPENESMDQETWLRRQAEGGNCFYDAVEEGMWTMRPRDQKVLSLLMPLVERIRELEASKETVERESRAQLDALKGQHEDIIASLKTENQAQLDASKGQHEDITTSLKRENQAQLDALKGQEDIIASLKREMDSLRMKMERGVADD